MEVNSWPMTFILDTLLWPCLSPVCFSCLEGAGSMVLLVLQKLGKRCDPLRHQPGLFSRAQMRALMGLGLAPREGETTCSRRKRLNQAPWPPTQSEHRWTDILPEVVTLGAFSSCFLINWTGCPWYREIKGWKAGFTADFQTNLAALLQCRGFIHPVGPTGDLHLCHNLSSWQCAPYSFQPNHVLL